MAKVLLVANTAWSLYKFRKNIIKQLIEAGHIVILHAPYDEFADKLVEIGATFYAAFNLSSKGMNPVKDLLYFKELKHFYKKINPDIVFQYTIKPNIYGTLAAKFNRIPSISIITGLGYTFIKGSLLTKFVRCLYRFSLRWTKEVWFLNTDDKELFINEQIIKNDKAVLLTCGEGIDAAAEYNPAEIKPHSFGSLEGGGINFILICRLLFDKGVREYVNAARLIKQQYQEVTFHIIGYLNVNNPSAISPEQMDSWVKEKLVVYHGSTDDVRPFIMGADCLVLPSYREGMSTILMEAASLAKPVITTDIPGCREIVENNVTGFLCKVKDDKDLADKMRTFIDLSNVQKKEMGVKARIKMSSEFSTRKVFKIYEIAINNA